MTNATDLCVLDPSAFQHYIARFTRLHEEDIINAIPDQEAWNWLQRSIPFFECSDAGIEETYYFRWWIYRKHIKQTQDGFVVTEFLPDARHAGKHNTINCPVGHQLYEGRWIKNQRYLDDYCLFMLRKGGRLHNYSCWFADALYKRYCVHRNADFAVEVLSDLVDYFRKWEDKKVDGLFYSTPWTDGMEFSISGSKEKRLRPTLNAYMYADAIAISRIADLAENDAVADEFRQEASALKAKVQDRLWNPDLEFFATKDLEGSFTPIGEPVREAVGYVPWQFDLPDPGFEAAWKHINDPQGFNTPVGLTTAEARHSMFLKVNPERRASWDGGIWPFASAQTLTAFQNILRNYHQSHVSNIDYIRELSKYALSHVRDGKPSIREVVRDPYVRRMRGSKHYNHSTFCDLVINGAVGLIPREDNILQIHPLISNAWDYFCLDGVLYHDHLITLSWDKSGTRYGKQGFHILVDKKPFASSDSIAPLVKELPDNV